MESPIANNNITNQKWDNAMCTTYITSKQPMCLISHDGRKPCYMIKPYLQNFDYQPNNLW